jgi:hypothetical protein
MRLAATTVALALALACSDPLHDEAVEALGPEDPAVPEGPLHRPGQPCLVCHGGDGPADSEFVVAGTVYAGPDDPTPVAAATIEVIGKNLRSGSATSNCAGNFFIPLADFTLAFPATTTVTGAATKPMLTLLNRTGSCNDCHRGNPGPDSPGLVWAPAAAGAACTP